MFRFSTLADIIASLDKAEREGCLRERIRWLARGADPPARTPRRRGRPPKTGADQHAG